MTKPRIFLAFPVTMNDTADEQAIILLLSKEWEVVSPNTPEHTEGYKAQGISYFDEVVRGCDALGVRYFPDGTLGAGVAKQMEVARAAGKQVLHIGGPDVSIGEWDVSADIASALTVEETRATIAAIRAEREAA